MKAGTSRPPESEFRRVDIPPRPPYGASSAASHASLQEAGASAKVTATDKDVRSFWRNKGRAIVVPGEA